MVGALAMLRRFWWAPIILGLVIALLIQRADIARKDGKLQHAADVMAITVERIKGAEATARANDLAHARAVETAQAKATQETENALIPAIDAARADARRYAAQLRAQAAASGGSVPNLPYAGGPAFDPDATGDPTELDALRCADAVIKAEGWQTFWRKAFPGAPK